MISLETAMIRLCAEADELGPYPAAKLFSVEINNRKYQLVLQKGHSLMDRDDAIALVFEPQRPWWRRIFQC